MDSVKTEGRDYVRAGLPAPGPASVVNFIHGEFSHTVSPGAPEDGELQAYIHSDLVGCVSPGPPGERFLPCYIHGGFTHTVSTVERSTLTGKILTKEFIYNSISVDLSND